MMTRSFSASPLHLAGESKEKSQPIALLVVRSTRASAAIVTVDVAVTRGLAAVVKRMPVHLVRTWRETGAQNASLFPPQVAETGTGIGRVEDSVTVVVLAAGGDLIEIEMTDHRDVILTKVLHARIWLMIGVLPVNLHLAKLLVEVVLKKVLLGSENVAVSPENLPKQRRKSVGSAMESTNPSDLMIVLAAGWTIFPSLVQGGASLRVGVDGMGRLRVLSTAERQVKTDGVVKRLYLHPETGTMRHRASGHVSI
jgi:hypothetical protein